jgi:glycosyltransferase involved in cell wall biosynthesis
MSHATKLSAVIITYNEEKNIERCLDSLKDVADEIVVVDSSSTDKTPNICQRKGVIFYQNPLEGPIDQRNYALSKAGHDFIISINANEALSPELREEIIRLKKLGLKDEGYTFNRLTRYVNKWIHHCGWYPDKKLRIIKKDRALWAGNNHEQFLKLKGHAPTIQIKGDLHHYSYNSIGEHVAFLNQFSTTTANDLFAQGKSANIFQLVLSLPARFIGDYFFKKGILDGRYGFIICLLNGVCSMLTIAKLRDLQQTSP